MDRNTDRQNDRRSLPLLEVIAQECARVLGGRAQEHTGRAKALLDSSFARLARPASHPATASH